MTQSNTMELVSQLKDLLKINRSIRSLNINWEQGKSVVVTSEFVAPDPDYNRTPEAEK